MKTNEKGTNTMDTQSRHADVPFQDGDLVLVELRTSSTFAGEQGEDGWAVCGSSLAFAHHHRCKEWSGANQPSDVYT